MGYRWPPEEVCSLPNTLPIPLVVVDQFGNQRNTARTQLPVALWREQDQASSGSGGCLPCGCQNELCILAGHSSQ